jgi:hypothetical protein
MTAAMQRLIWSAALLAVLAPGSVQGQWWGPIIDKIGEMSGPRMQYVGVTYRFGYQPSQFLDTAVLVRTGAAFDAARRRASPPQLDAAHACFGTVDSIARPMAAGYDERIVDPVRRDLRRLHRRVEALTDGTPDAARSATLRNEICYFRDVLVRLGVDPSRRYPNSGFVWRVGAFTGHDLNNDDARTADVYGLMIKTTLEYNVTLANNCLLSAVFPAIGLGIEGGINAHYFHGNIAPFWYQTYPIMLNLYPFARQKLWLLRNIKTGVGTNLVPPTQPHAFDEIPSYKRSEWHFSNIGWHVGLDITLDSFLPISRLR